ncbi:hypothetical protein EWM64_g5987 [Hericium alpestre]|uniref:Uncharacterized protein n=1 Tax=Hericium alpestre TaxID=135208 RepID=A0A4Y9ZX16_9AGAM|nr:hypothetical protein EWM64_g5987 [Hericium alpestre]
MQSPTIAKCITRSLQVSSSPPLASTRRFMTSSPVKLPGTIKSASVLVPDPSIYEGHITSLPTDQSTHSEYARAGFAAHSLTNEHPYDAASPHGVRHSTHACGSNPEHIGFADQVGGQSAFGCSTEEGRGGNVSPVSEVKEQEAVAPGVYAACMQALGFTASVGDVKGKKADSGVGGPNVFSDRD